MINFFRRSGAVAVWYHPAYRLPLAQSVGAPASPRRADDALTWALDTRVIRPDSVHTSPELSWDDAALVHSQDYLASLDRPDAVAAILGSEPERVSVASIIETWRRGAGATVAALAELAARGGRAVNLLGGFHHAEPTRGAGFCALNDVAIAIVKLRAGGFTGAITIVDLDAHPPDGVVACLGDDPAVSVLSLSTASAWTIPAARHARVIDARIPAGATDDAYLAAVDALLASLGTCALALYVAGGDPLAGDRLGGLAVSEAGLRERDRRVFHALGSTPTLALAAGGYSDRSWRVLAGTVAEAAKRKTRIHPTFDPLLSRSRAVMSRLDPHTLQGDAPLLTEADLLEALHVTVEREPRFLDYYTRHGLEHALTAYGFLPTLRRLGFSDLQVAIEGGVHPHRMRITAAVGSQRAVLVDLSVSIRPLAHFRVLFVEWLELRDPRVPFGPDRPRLPGQELPGLGLAEETGYMLVRAAERLGLHGVSFIPAHYHVAWIARGRFVAVDPAARGRIRAIERAVAGLPLREATERLGGQGLATVDGDPIRWQPVEMVASVDPALAAWLADGEGETLRAEAEMRVRLLVGP